MPRGPQTVYIKHNLGCNYQNDTKNKQHRDSKIRCTKALWICLPSPDACSYPGQTSCCTLSLFHSFKLTGMLLTSGRGERPKNLNSGRPTRKLFYPEELTYAFSSILISHTITYFDTCTFLYGQVGSQSKLHVARQ